MKIKQKLISIILTFTIAMGLATAPAFATSGPLLVESYWEEYLNGSNGSWAASSSDFSLPTVPSKYGNSWAKALLNQLYYIWREADDINTALSSSSSVQSSNFGKAMYYLGSATFQNKIANIESYLYNINGYLNTISGYLNTYLPDLKSGLTSANQHLGSISSMLGYSNSNTLKSNIDSVISGITSSNTNTSNIKSVLDNIYGSLGYNSAGTLKTAISSIISNTSDISGIKSGTDYIDDIAADTGSLPTIENNSSAIKINSDYLPGISTYTSNLPAIKANTDYIDDIYNVLSNISNSSLDFNNINWVNTNGYLGVKTSLTGDYLTSNNIYSSDFYAYFSSSYGTNIYKLVLPLRCIYPSLSPEDVIIEPILYANSVYKPFGSVLSYERNRQALTVYLYLPSYTDGQVIIHVYSNSPYTFSYSSNGIEGVYTILADHKDFYDVQNWVYNFNFMNILAQAKDMFFDDSTVNAKNSNKPNENIVLSNFTGSGAASASTSDFNGVKDSVTQLKSALSGGASYSQTFNIFGGSSDGWSWFSQEVANSMDSTSQSRNMLRGNISSSTPYLDSYYDSIYSVLGIGGDIE